MSAPHFSVDLAGEQAYENFEQAIAKEDQQMAQAIIKDLNRKEYFELAEQFAQELMEQPWFCADCSGTGEIVQGEFDNITTNPCPSCKDTQ